MKIWGFQLKKSSYVQLKLLTFDMAPPYSLIQRAPERATFIYGEQSKGFADFTAIMQPRVVHQSIFPNHLLIETPAIDGGNSIPRVCRLKINRPASAMDREH